MINLNTFRDVLSIQHDENIIITAVDSCGGIGEKTNDIVYCKTSFLSEQTLKVALFEVIALGAKPEFITIAVSNEQEIANKALIGFEGVFEEIGKIPFTISSEKNMPTSMTAIGISVTGICSIKDYKIGNCNKGDILCLAGIPLVGEEVIKNYDKMLKLKNLLKLVQNKFVGSILPVGSKGVLRESEVLELENNCNIQLFENTNIDLTKSGGPSSCALFSIKKSRLETLDIPFIQLGVFS